MTYSVCIRKEAIETISCVSIHVSVSNRRFLLAWKDMFYVFHYYYIAYAQCVYVFFSLFIVIFNAHTCGYTGNAIVVATVTPRYMAMSIDRLDHIFKWFSLIFFLLHKTIYFQCFCSISQEIEIMRQCGHRFFSRCISLKHWICIVTAWTTFPIKFVDLNLD